MSDKLDSKKLLLLLLYLPTAEDKEINEPIKGSTRIQKMMFIYEKEIHNKYDYAKLIDFNPEFFAFNYGPFSSKVLDDIRFLSNAGFIKELNLNENSDIEDFEFVSYENYEYTNNDVDTSFSDKNYIEYSLTEKGIRFVDQKIINIFKEKPDLERVLIEFKNKIINMPLTSIIKYVYNRYPEMTINSKIKDKV